MPITFKRAGQEAVALENVSFKGVALDKVTFKRAGHEAVTVFEKITQLATPQNVTADGTTVSWDAVENATSYAVLADGSEIGTVEGAATDELAGTWVFNDTLEFSSIGLSQDESKSWSVDFTSLVEHTRTPNTIRIEYGLVGSDEEGNEYIGYSLNYVYNPTSGVPELYLAYVSNGPLAEYIGWTDLGEKTITITSKLSEVTNGYTLLEWLQANATKQ